METGLHELPLVIFTVIGQAVVGAFWIFSLLLLTDKTETTQRRAHYAMTALWVLMALGFIASTTHLGSPSRAFNALNRIGQSGLSNEIAAGSLFFAAGAAYWALTTLKYLPPRWQQNGMVAWLTKTFGFLTALQPLLLLVVSLLGAGFIYAMSALYLIPTVPTWNTVYTPIAFVLTALLAGFGLAVCLLNAAGIGKAWQKYALIAAGLAWIAAIFSNYQHYLYLQATDSAVVRALDLVPDFALYSVVRIVLLALGLALAVLAYRRQTVGLALIGVLCLFAAEGLARVMFYGSHMTVGMKALGL